MSTEHQESRHPWPVRLTGRRRDRELQIVPIEPRIFAGFFALLILEPFVECGSRLVYLQVARVHLVVFAIRTRATWRYTSRLPHSTNGSRMRSAKKPAKMRGS